MSAVLPDCGICGGPVRLEMDGTGTAEECGWCHNRQRPIRVTTAAEREAIREAVKASRARRLLGPSCLGRRHTRCTAQLCECTCHPDQRPRRADASA